MDINSVFDELKAVAEKNDKLYRDMSELEKSIAANVVKNYYEIVQPVETKLAHLLKDIRETARFTKSAPMDGEVRELFLGPEVDSNKVSLFIKITTRGVLVAYRADGHGYGELWTSIHNAKECSISNTLLALFAPWFSNEEKANELVECIKEAYKPLLEWHKKQFEAIGNDLSETVEHLKGVLEGSHTIEQNEDGTVEIQLGGKTYIGKVKEA